jgi:hypothetical protein
LALTQIKVGFSLTHPLHPELVSLFVALCARCPDCRALLYIEHPELKARHVSGLTHLPTHRVNLSGEMSLRQASNSRIARHLPNGIRIDRKKKSLTSHPCSSERGFDSSVARTDHDYIVFLCEGEHTY